MKRKREREGEKVEVETSVWMRETECVEEKREDAVKEEEEGNLEKGGKHGGWRESCWNVRCTGKVGAGAFAEGIV